MNRRRTLSFVFLAFGLGVALYLNQTTPHEQHLRVVLGEAAKDVTGIEIQYVAEDGETARDMRASYDAGAAPRIVSHEPKLPDGPYTVRVDVDTRGGRK